jgi:hypothetical protein
LITGIKLAEAPSEPPSESELRAVLAQAIAQAAAAQQAVEDGRAAIERASNFVSEAKSRGEAAAAGVADAQARFVERAAAAARDDAAPSGISMRAARAAEADAADELAACTAALGEVRAALPSLEEESRVAKHHVEKAANVIVAHAVAPLLLQSEKLRVELLQNLAILRSVSDVSEEAMRRRRFNRQSPAEARADDKAVAALAGVRSGINRVVASLLADLDVLNNASEIWKKSAAVGPWAEWQRALMEDPQAPAPLR